METLKDLTAELIIWLDSECPAVAPPLEPYDNSDLSHNFCELLRIRLDEINRLRSQVEPTKKRKYTHTKICAGCGSFAHGNPGHDIT